jgi:hypothetical protein
MMLLAGLLILGSFADLSNPDYANVKVGLYLVIALCAASLVGGRHLYKKGWQQGHDFVNVMSVLPAAVLVVLIAFGALAQATHQNPPHGFLRLHGGRETDVCLRLRRRGHVRMLVQ